jgi:hypothetical protein
MEDDALEAHGWSIGLAVASRDVNSTLALAGEEYVGCCCAAQERNANRVAIGSCRKSNQRNGLAVGAVAFEKGLIARNSQVFKCV